MCTNTCERNKRKYDVYKYSVELEREPLGGYDSQGNPITDLFDILKNKVQLDNKPTNQNYVISREEYTAGRREVFEDTLNTAGEDVALGFLKKQQELDKKFDNDGKDNLFDLYLKYADKLDKLKVV